MCNYKTNIIFQLNSCPRTSIIYFWSCQIFTILWPLSCLHSVQCLNIEPEVYSTLPNMWRVNNALQQQHTVHQGIVQLKILPHPHVMSNLFDFLPSAKHKEDISKNVEDQTKWNPHWRQVSNSWNIFFCEWLNKESHKSLQPPGGNINVDWILILGWTIP